MTPNDIVATLHINNMIKKNECDSTYNVIIDQDCIDEHLRKLEAKNYPRIKPENLRWTPYILHRTIDPRNLNHSDNNNNNSGGGGTGSTSNINGNHHNSNIAPTDDNIGGRNRVNNINDNEAASDGDNKNNNVKVKKKVGRKPKRKNTRFTPY